MTKALLLIDLQNDFCPGGSLAVSEGDCVIPVANRVISACQTAHAAVVASLDWHPADHRSFAVNSGTTIGEVGELEGLPQVWWPAHCVAGEPGAEFHPALEQQAIDWIVRKGTDSSIDSYSAFFDNGHRVKTELDDWLRARHIDSLTIMGLATDYCVKYTVLDALALGYHTEVLVDGCRGVNLQPADSQEALQEMRARGAILTDSHAFISALASSQG
ncbi:MULTISPECIES: bifunctional nicotinamidase/pyrazinamidase [Lonsdalea]|uniref:Nicotinamidase n=2 Tax=Lonsdalea TaxID=1082702 RepID=A0ACD1JFR6_9GAMM|nr:MULTISPECIES: bifunctional nicotinamidase/pyrazinamidase [Lonsdalea]OSN00897.1 nicotinamidase [Lonsdalea populi]QPQ25733.1 bifunctional nicotinamidase/pyrazinamidase [Lonsdalea populi]RAT14293.1 nicotinamidase [Lonsdalea quercina]RAT16324.1 nicotinamidase [Lonsdalea quercina]RAT18511.1 nicotinamidase [Lonsdalea populi]